ncbi:MAG: biofilm-associated protein, partial [Nitrosopumilaceae archaeon]
MQKSSKGIFLSLLLVSSLMLVALIDDVEAQEKPVTAKSVGFEKTTIVEFENAGDVDVQTFRLWLGSDSSFKSFKTEKGWTGQKTPQGVLVFTTEIPVKPGESVKFGIKTD